MAKGPYRTIVYVDGFNFYYGEVRGTPWKWLDLAALFQKVLGRQEAPASGVTGGQMILALFANVKPVILAQAAQKNRYRFQRAMLGGPFDVFRKS